MDERVKKWIGYALIAVAVIIAGFLGVSYPMPDMPIGARGVMDVIVPTYALTATPGFVVNNKSASAVGLQVQDDGTPVYNVNADGSIAQTGDQTVTGRVIVAGPTTIATAQAALDVSNAGVGEVAEFNDGSTELMGIRNGGGVVVTGPTAVATAQPALVVDNAGVSQVFSMRDGGSEIIGGRNGGGVVVTAPTAVATAQPAFVVDSPGVSNLLEVRDAATPVAYVPNGGGLRVDGGMTNIGGGTCGVADGDNDVCIAGVLEVDDEAEFDGAIDADSTSNFADTATFSKGSGDAVIISAGGTLSLPATADLGALGYVYIGNGTPNGAVTAGTDEQLYCEGALEVDGAADIADTATFSKGSGTALSVSSGGLAVFNGGAEVNGTLTLQNDETIVNSTDGTITMTVASAGHVAISTGNFAVGNPATAGETMNGNDAYVEGTMEVDGAAYFDGAVDADSTADIADTLTLSKGSGTALSVSSGGSVAVASGDVTISGDSSNGNAGTRNEFIGLPRIRMKGLDQGTNGAAAGKTVDLDDDTPSGEFVASDADVTVSDDATYYQEGAASLKIAFSTDSDEGDGAHDAVANLDWTDDESMGFWFYADRTLTAGDLVVDLTDDGGSQKTNIPAYATANTWVWVEITLPAGNADKDVISDISFELSAAGAAVAAGGAFNVYIDAMYKWDSTEEDALGAAILDHGVLGVVDTENGDDLVLYTEYFVHYESGNDYIVWITDESASDILVLYAY